VLLPDGAQLSGVGLVRFVLPDGAGAYPAYAIAITVFAMCALARMGICMS
jgi:hypothetical protein